MGMYDESWCSGCGRSITYTEQEDAQCGDCVNIDFHEFKKMIASIVYESDQSYQDRVEDIKEILRFHLINKATEGDKDVE